MDNRAIAQRLLEYARFLDARADNLYRVRAYRRAADTVLTLDRPVEDIVTATGRKGLEELPGIGVHLSYTIDGLVRTGEFRTMDREGGHSNAQAERLSQLTG
jgi:DNA polymerase (family 10)